MISYRLPLIPDALQGRVNSSFRLLAFGFQPLGSALAGFLIQSVGPVGAVGAFSIWYLGMALLVTLNAHVRHARPIEEVQQAG